MMKMDSLNNLSKLPVGTTICGKWHGKTYKIIKELGSGANGIVYLAEGEKERVAIKLSDNPNTVTSEVNVLKELSKAQGITLGPSLLDVDDWAVSGKSISFYVMEYIEGSDFLSFIKQKDKAWVDVLILQLLADLHHLHAGGWVFGDIKPENLIVAGPPMKIRCIDVGGVTRIGRAIKEFTEFFDRGYWGLGTRKADPGYDLFAVAMMMINVFYPHRFQRQENPGISQLIEIIDQHSELKEKRNILIRALKGEYKTALEMRRDLLLHKRQIIEKRPAGSGKGRAKMGTSLQRKTKRNGSSFFETVLMVIFIFFLYAMYIMRLIL